MNNGNSKNVANTALSLLFVVGLFLITGESDTTEWQLVTTLGGLALVVLSCIALHKLND